MRAAGVGPALPSLRPNVNAKHPKEHIFET